MLEGRYCNPCHNYKDSVVIQVVCIPFVISEPPSSLERFVAAIKQLNDLLDGRVNLPASAETLAEQYSSAKPFEHLVIDNLFPNDMVEGLLAEMPGFNDPNWFLFDDGNLLKFNTRSPVEFGPKAAEFAGFLHSALFLHLMSSLTGVEDLIPDPYMHGGGFHGVPRGGKFDIHVDSNIHKTTGLHRRIAIIVFLNKEWKEEYNGALELWDESATACGAKVYPTFNRTVIFNSGEKTYHGYPDPLACPRGMFRRSFLAYYYTNDAKDFTSHSTIYAPSFQREFKLRQLLEDYAPPALLRSARKLKARLG